MATIPRSAPIIGNVFEAADHDSTSRPVRFGRHRATLLAQHVLSSLSAAVVPLLESLVADRTTGLSTRLDNGSCSLDTIQQDMERLPQGTRRLAVRLRMDLDPAWLWAVLTDYAHLSRFIPNLETSRLLWRRANVVGLEQVGSQSFMGLRFKAQVQLELTEELEQQRLSFVMVKGDFRRFEGVWQIGHDRSGTTLLYELTVQGCVGMPIALIEQRLRDDLATNLRAVQQEALRRAAAAG